LSYRRDSRLTSDNKKEFKVRMGFGLHAGDSCSCIILVKGVRHSRHSLHVHHLNNKRLGWAIEGAVGSIHKVDATYLSPHVNMAARLETSSRFIHYFSDIALIPNLFTSYPSLDVNTSYSLLHYILRTILFVNSTPFHLPISTVFYPHQQVA
jgi:hypothetical protein